jgi:hypothetical protein
MYLAPFDPRYPEELRLHWRETYAHPASATLLTSDLTVDILGSTSDGSGSYLPPSLIGVFGGDKTDALIHLWATPSQTSQSMIRYYDATRHDFVSDNAVVTDVETTRWPVAGLFMASSGRWTGGAIDITKAGVWFRGFRTNVAGKQLPGAPPRFVPRDVEMAEVDGVPGLDLIAGGAVPTRQVVPQAGWRYHLPLLAASSDGEMSASHDVQVPRVDAVAVRSGSQTYVGTVSIWSEVRGCLSSVVGAPSPSAVDSPPVEDTVLPIAGTALSVEPCPVRTWRFPVDDVLPRTREGEVTWVRPVDVDRDGALDLLLGITGRGVVLLVDDDLRTSSGTNSMPIADLPSCDSTRSIGSKTCVVHHRPGTSNAATVWVDDLGVWLAETASCLPGHDQENCGEKDELPRYRGVASRTNLTTGDLTEWHLGRLQIAAGIAAVPGDLARPELVYGVLGKPVPVLPVPSLVAAAMPFGAPTALGTSGGRAVARYYGSFVDVDLVPGAYGRCHSLDWTTGADTLTVPGVLPFHVSRVWTGADVEIVECTLSNTMNCWRHAIDERYVQHVRAANHEPAQRAEICDSVVEHLVPTDAGPFGQRGLLLAK